MSEYAGKLSEYLACDTESIVIWLGNSINRSLWCSYVECFVFDALLALADD